MLRSELLQYASVGIKANIESCLDGLNSSKRFDMPNYVQYFESRIELLQFQLSLIERELSGGESIYEI